jgi:5'-nucleotidase
VKILITNDDGIFFEGLHALHRALSTLGEVFVSAPAYEQSGISHAITYLKPLHATRLDPSMNMTGYTVDGTPSDCVRLAIAELMPEKPDLVVSGVNRGLNAGVNILYSGTVAGAREGAMFGIPSFAVSLEASAKPDYSKAAELLTTIIDRLMRQTFEEPITFNINVPTKAINSAHTVCFVPMETNRHGHHFVRGTDPGGRTYYWSSADPPPAPSRHDTDCTALSRGDVTITPIRFDMTDYGNFDKFQGAWHRA